VIYIIYVGGIGLGYWVLGLDIGLGLGLGYWVYKKSSV